MGRELGNLPSLERCTASLTDGSGTRCRKARVTGLSVCKSHGGGSPASILKSEFTKEQGAHYGSAMAAPDHEGASVVTGLGWELRRTIANLLISGQQIGELGQQDEEVYAALGMLDCLQERQRIAADRYQWERKHYSELLRMGLAAGIEARKISILERQLDVLNVVLEGVLSRLGHRLDDPAVRTAVHSQLAALATGQV